jgi:uncharacterized membrane protein YcaP (DUF421 family)
VDSPVRPFDLRRLFIGKTPPLFLLEIVVRAVFVYVILLVAVRLMGKRVAAQLSLSELAVIVTLGAAIGVPIEVPEHGMIPAAVVLAVAIAYQRGIGYLSFRKRRIELLTQGDLVVLMRDGVLDLRNMKRCGLSRERVFAALREKGLEQLGEVRRMYFETSGAFSIYRAVSPREGLSIVPADHPGLQPEAALAACTSCGTVVDKDRRLQRCPACHDQGWGDAVRVAPS